MQLASLVRESWERRFVRFLCVGSFNTLLDFTILNLLVAIGGLNELLANTISVSIGITISYFLNHKIVFREPQKYSLKAYLRFIAVTGLGVIIIQNLVIYLATHTGLANSGNTVHLLLINLSDKTVALNIGKALAIIVGMIWNYLLYKYVVFGRDKQADPADEIIVA